MDFDTVITYKQLGPALCCPPPPYLSHQTLIDFKDDVERNCQASEDESCFVQWAYPFVEQALSQTLDQSIANWEDCSTSDLELYTGKVGEGMTPMEQEKETKVPGSHRHPKDLHFAELNFSQIYTSRPATSKRNGRGGLNTRLRGNHDTSRAEVEQLPMSNNESKRPCRRLTLEQKRNNHIRHEHKRRSLIRDGFKELTDLIPELRGGTWSRSRILFKAAERIRALRESNEALVKQLDTLQNDELGK